MVARFRRRRFGLAGLWSGRPIVICVFEGVKMKRLFSCWLFSLVLALGISAPAFAGWEGDGHHDGHHHGGGGDPSADITKSFGKVFWSDRNIGREIDRAFNFTVGSQSSFSAMILSFGIDDFVGSIIGRQGNPFSESFSIDDGRTTFSTLLGPGRYSFVLQGTVADAPAAYFGGFSAVPVPEPAEWMMIIAGVAMMGIVVSRRRNIG